MQTANHLLKPVNVEENEDASTSIEYRPVKFPHEKIGYDISADSLEYADEYASKMDFDDSENDDGYHLGFTYNFEKLTITFFYYETNEEYQTKETVSIAKQTYKVDNSGGPHKLIKQHVNLSNDDKRQHRTKKDLLKELDVPKQSVDYLLSRRIDFYVLDDKVEQDLDKGSSKDE